jgi:Uma2 family endonuclease
MATRTRATVDDVLRLAAAGERYELIDGELAPMSPTGVEHGDIEIYAGWVLSNYVLPRKLGKVVGGEVLFGLDPEGTLARAPDLAFIRRERLRGIDLTGPFNGAPDLAVEIVSPGDSAKDLQRKTETWLAHGTLAVLLMYPEARSVVLWRDSGAIRLSGDDVLDLDPALPGFRCVIRDLFPPPLDDPGTLADGERLSAVDETNVDANDPFSS